MNGKIIYKEQIKIGEEQFTLQLSLCLDRLEARLISQSDPFFLYFCSINQQEYQILKSTQNLLILWNEFPQKLIELIECYRKNNEFNNSSTSSSRYMIKLDKQQHQQQDGYTMAIVEINSFRSVEIVKLAFQKAHESELKAHLHAFIGQLTGERDSFQHQLQKASNSLSEYLDKERALEKKIVQKREEIEGLKKDLEQCRISLSQSDAQMESLSKENTALKIQMQELRLENQKLTQNNFSLAEEESSKRKELAKANEAISRFQQEQAKLKATLKSLESAEEKHGEKEISLVQRIEELKKTLEERETKLGKMHELQSQFDRTLLQNKHMEMELKAQNQLLMHFHREVKPSGFVVEPSKKLPPIPRMEENSLLVITEERKLNDFDSPVFGSVRNAFVVPETPKFSNSSSRRL